MNRYPPGNEVLCRFYFALRPLTPTEEAAYFDGLGLPSGVGFDPSTVRFIYTPPEGTETEIAATRDAAGAYHAIVRTEDGEDGVLTYKGRGLNSEGQPIATTTPRVFAIG
jgi:hypothetical protein